jgi:spore germination protein KB
MVAYMYNNTKISSSQLRDMIATYTAGTTIIVVSSDVASIAKQDAWMSPIIAMLFGMVVLSIYISLGKLYPNMTFLQMIELAFGKWIGKTISLVFVVICIITLTQVVWYVGKFFNTQSMPEMPMYAINIFIIIPVLIGTYYGIEVIGRSSKIFAIVFTALFCLCMILVSPKSNPENLLPILENGFTPVLKGAFVTISWMVFPIVIFLMVYPANVDNDKKVNRSIFMGFIWGSMLIILGNIISVLVLGSTIASRADYPTYLLAKEIHVGEVFNRMEGLISGSWIITIFFRILMYFYAVIIGLKQIFGLKEYKYNILPLGIIVASLSGFIYKDAYYQTEYDMTTWIFFILTFGFLLPIILLVIGLIKKSFRI